jgi:hypothetical protein
VAVTAGTVTAAAGTTEKAAAATEMTAMEGTAMMVANSRDGDSGNGRNNNDSDGGSGNNREGGGRQQRQRWRGCWPVSSISEIWIIWNITSLGYLNNDRPWSLV